MKKNYLFLILCMILINIGLVNAEELNINPTNYYFHRLSPNDDFSDRYKNYDINGNTAYCIEPGLHEGQTYKVGSWENVNLSDDVKEKIKLYSYYGYDYSGHKTTKYRAATQSLIWKSIMGTGSTVTFSSELFGRGTIWDVKDEENKINELVLNHKKVPEFDLSDFYYVGEKIALKDKNEVLKSFNVETEAESSVRGSTLYITPQKTGKLTVTFKKIMDYKNNYIIYESNGYQTMFSPGNIDDVINKIELNIKGGTITINKTDEDKKPLSNVEFSLYANEQIGTFKKGDLVYSGKTNDLGILIINDLFPGEYILKEIKCPEGYIKDEKDHTIKLKVKDKELNYKIDLVNKKEKKIILKDVPKTSLNFIEYLLMRVGLI